MRNLVSLHLHHLLFCQVFQILCTCIVVSEIVKPYPHGTTLSSRAQCLVCAFKSYKLHSLSSSWVGFSTHLAPVKFFHTFVIQLDVLVSVVQNILRSCIHWVHSSLYKHLMSFDKCMVLHIHHCSTEEYSTTPNPFATPVQLCLYPQISAVALLFTVESSAFHVQCNWNQTVGSLFRLACLY